MKTIDLTDAALDWAATRANYKVNFDTVWAMFRNECAYSTDWAQGGPIIDRECIAITTIDCTPNWEADIGGTIKATGPTPLIAAMRCYVASKLGEEVEVPDEL